MAQKYVKPAQAARPLVKPVATDNQPVKFIYDKSNYTLLGISVLIVAIGFFIMAGTTDIYSNAKIVVAPLVVLAGFGLGFYALLKKPESQV